MSAIWYKETVSFQPATFIKKEKIAENTYKFYFFTKRKIKFHPGQYVSLLIDEQKKDFTITSLSTDEYLSLITKKSESEFKRKLFGFKKGAALQISKAKGEFGIVPSTTDIVFLAGGIGITPFYSMVFEHQKTKRKNSLTLLTSFSSEEEMIFENELEEITAKNPQIKTIFTITRSISQKNEQGRISKKLLEKYIPDFSSKIFYIAGSPSFISDMEELLLQNGVALENIRTDIFTGY